MRNKSVMQKTKSKPLEISEKDIERFERQRFERYQWGKYT